MLLYACCNQFVIIFSKDSLIGLHPDEEAAVIHALRQSLKATRDISAPREVHREGVWPGM